MGFNFRSELTNLNNTQEEIINLKYKVPIKNMQEIREGKGLHNYK